MAWTQTDLDALDDAIRALYGTAKTVRFQDREYTKRDVDELLRLRAFISGQVSAAAGAGSSVSYVKHSKLT